MLLVFVLTVTGFEIHGNYNLVGYECAVRLHNSAAWTFIGLGILSIVYMLSSKQYKNFIPTKEKLGEQIKYYTSGIFKNEPHPTKKSLYNKLNPLQRIIYVGLLIVVFPVQIFTGLIYMFYHYPQNPADVAGFKFAAITHTLGAFLMVAFVLVHVYMTTTGHKLTSGIKSMITGYEEEPLENKPSEKPENSI
jgi:thiosulfate reductase cytochrome b subunit